MNWRIILFLCVFFLFTCSNTSVDVEKDHIQIARQLVELTFNRTVYHDNAIKYALLAIKERGYESNPKTKPYSAILTNALMEVMEAYTNDPDSEEKAKDIAARIYKDEFTETELREMVKFYRSKTWQKFASKIPVVTKKQWDLESQVVLPQKYQQMIADKVETLKSQGKLPKEFN